MHRLSHREIRRDNTYLIGMTKDICIKKFFWCDKLTPCRTLAFSLAKSPEIAMCDNYRNFGTMLRPL